MPLIIMVLVSSLAIFQMFFRYEHWNSEKYDGIVYERDALTGEIHVLQPGQEVDFVSRVFGKQVILPENMDAMMDGQMNIQLHPDLKNAIKIEPVAMAGVKTEEAANNQTPQKTEALQMAMISDSKEIQKKQDTTPSRINPDSTPASKTAKVELKPNLQDRFISRQIDLNLDGDSEEIVQSVSLDDGLIDISVVRHNKEIFYGRGKYLHILSSRRFGWSDIAMNINDREVKYFQYDPKQDGYTIASAPSR